MPISKVLFWGGFGLAVRVWQLGIEMVPIFERGRMWAYPVYAGVGASFGYWLENVGKRQDRLLKERRDILLEKRRRLAESEARSGAAGDEAILGH